MTERNLAYINPDLLKYSREEVGFSRKKAAKNIVNEKKLMEVEEGNEYLTFNQLERLANRLKLPITYFYRAEPYKDELAEKFRSIKSRGVHFSPELREILLDIKNKRSLAIEYSKFDEMDYDYKYVNSIEIDKIPNNAKIIEIADELRKLFVFEVPKSKWKNEYDALNNWIRCFDRLGVLIFQISGISVNDMRGFSISEIPYPTIGVNRSDSPLARIFTLLHEFSHIGVSDENKYNFSNEIPRPFIYGGEDPDNSKLETFCNRLASEILVPTKEFQNLKLIRDHKGMEWSDDDLNRLKRRYWVSREVILLKLLQISKSNENFYKTKISEWDVKKKKSGFEYEQHKKVMRKNSNIFLRIILSAYAEGEITASKLTHFLNMKLKHLENLEKDLVSNLTNL